MDSAALFETGRRRNSIGAMEGDRLHWLTGIGQYLGMAAVAAALLRWVTSPEWLALPLWGWLEIVILTAPAWLVLIALGAAPAYLIDKLIQRARRRRRDTA